MGEEEARKLKERQEFEKRQREEQLRKQMLEEERRIAEKQRIEKQRMENEIRELLKEQKLRATQEDQRRKLEDLRLLEIQDALKQRDEEAAKIEKEFEEAKRKRALALKRLDEERLRDLQELELIENSRKAA